MNEKKSTREPKPGIPTGYALLGNSLYNKGSAFPDEERDALGLRGLLPPRVFSMEEQVLRVMENYSRKTTDLERYIHLNSLHDRNETLFYRILVDNVEKLMPIVYTPTVGQACQEFGHIFRRSRGLYITANDRGHVKEILRRYPRQDIRVIVVTDGERILGLGDQGASGMGIPIGKLSLYTACCGISPAQTCPITIDVGTENEAYLADPLYMGLRQHRVRGQAFDDLMEEFILAVQEVWPKALVQFEDFGNANAFRLLEHWRDRVCTFNDDIQGTAGVTLAGLLTSLRVTKKALKDQRILFLGAGEAGIGIGDLIVSAMVDDGMDVKAARRNCWFFDSKGLVVEGRAGLAEHKQRFAHPHKQVGEFLAAIKELKPTAIVGVSTMPKTFNQAVIEEMSRLNEYPIIFSLSNPTSKSECTAGEAYTWSKGKALFASGSPFPPFEYEGKTYVPGQGNNSYIFPGVGLGIVASEATRVTDRMFSAAARALDKMVLESDLAMGRVYPSLKRIREISAVIGAAVADIAYADGLARAPKPVNTHQYVKSIMWEPKYDSYLK